MSCTPDCDKRACCDRCEVQVRQQMTCGHAAELLAADLAPFALAERATGRQVWL